MLSGKEPWSEFGEYTAVVLRLSRGETPGRPKSRPIDDRYWRLIEHCFSPVSKRPAASLIASSIKQFLNDFPSSQPLREVMALLSSANFQQLETIRDDSSSSPPLVDPGDGAMNGIIGLEPRHLHASTWVIPPLPHTKRLMPKSQWPEWPSSVTTE